MLKQLSRYLLAGLLVVAGSNHFLNRPFYVRIMPPSIPFPRQMVELSGACEIALGAALLSPRCRSLAAWGIIALLLAVFPANVHMARHSEQYPEYKPALLWARLPFQALLVGWAFWHTRSDRAIQH